MEYNWYKVFNLTEFQATGLVSRTYDMILTGIGQVSILVTAGNFVSMLYEGVFLSIGMNDRSPFAVDGHAIYKDENNDVWLGIEIAKD